MADVICHARFPVLQLTMCVCVPALAKVRLIQEQAEDQANRAKALVAMLDDIENKLDDLKNNSRHAIDNAQASQDLNHRNRQNKDSIVVSAASC